MVAGSIPPTAEKESEPSDFIDVIITDRKSVVNNRMKCIQKEYKQIKGISVQKGEI